MAMGQGPALGAFNPGAILNRSGMAEVAQPAPTGMLTDASAMAISNASVAEEMANELQRIVNNFLGSEPTVDAKGEEAQPEEPCLYGSLVSSNRRVLAALKEMQGLIGRLDGAYSV